MKLQFFSFRLRKSCDIRPMVDLAEAWIVQDIHSDRVSGPAIFSFCQIHFRGIFLRQLLNGPIQHFPLSIEPHSLHMHIQQIVFYLDLFVLFDFLKDCTRVFIHLHHFVVTLILLSRINRRMCELNHLAPQTVDHIKKMVHLDALFLHFLLVIVWSLLLKLKFINNLDKLLIGLSNLILHKLILIPLLNMSIALTFKLRLQLLHLRFELSIFLL